jgi:hypothetical protein
MVRPELSSRSQKTSRGVIPSMQGREIGCRVRMEKKNCCLILPGCRVGMEKTCCLILPTGMDDVEPRILQPGPDNIDAAFSNC